MKEDRRRRRSKQKKSERDDLDDDDLDDDDDDAEGTDESGSNSLSGPFDSSGEESQIDYSAHWIIEGTLKIPNFIWKKLYPHQKQAVEWFFNLHTEQKGGIL